VGYLSKHTVTDKELQKLLEEKQKQVIDEKQKWVNKMIKSAKQQHKICPYFDKKTKQCFITLGLKCDREGKFETCPVFKAFLERKYDEYRAKGAPLPMSFADITLPIV